MTSPPTLPRRLRGSLLGLAISDALGAPVEFKVRGTFTPVTDMQPNPKFKLGPGYFTDDTSMALCLALSFLENDLASIPVDQARKYFAWYRSGYQSSAGRCFDIGNLTRSALGVWRGAVIASDYAAKNESSADSQAARWKAQTAITEAQATMAKRFSEDRFASNGSLMRVAPCALLFADDVPRAVKAAAESSRVTHPHPRCVLCCALYTLLVARCLRDAEVSKERLVACMVEFVESVRDVVATAELSSASRSRSKAKTTIGTTSGSSDGATSFVKRFERYTRLDTFLANPASQIRSTGSVLDTLEAALWAFFTTTSFHEGALKAVNLGGDADTAGAVYGGLAGAFYGDEELPAEWVSALKGRELVEDVVKRIVGVWEERAREGEEKGMREDVRIMIRAGVDMLEL